jgi:hypothetical protein
MQASFRRGNKALGVLASSPIMFSVNASDFLSLRAERSIQLPECSGLILQR